MIFTFFKKVLAYRDAILSHQFDGILHIDDLDLTLF